MAREIYDIDVAHSQIGFAVRHMVISKVHGRFDDWSGTILFDEHDLGSSEVDVRIEAGSINTNEAHRDAHLRSADFLDVEAYPKIVFISTRVKAAGRRRFRIVGDLALHGSRREVVIDARYSGRVRDPAGRERVGFVGHMVVDRGDFGLRWNAMVETGGVVVGEKVEVEIHVEAVGRGA